MKDKNDSQQAQEPEVAYQNSPSNDIAYSNNEEGLNPSQIHLLRLFSINKTTESEAELKEALFDFYYHKLKQKEDEMWATGAMSQELLDRINNTDLHKL